MDGITGEIRIFSGDFAPIDWLKCDGTALDKNAYRALFSVIGYTYGGKDNLFNLPNLGGRTPLGSGGDYKLGSTGGATSYRIDNIPKHRHRLIGANKPVAAGNPSGEMPANFNSRDAYYAAVPADKTLNPTTVYPVGVETIGPALNNEQPYMAINYIICTDGQFPY